MSTGARKSTRKSVVPALRQLDVPTYELHLFIAGTTPRSAAALANLTALCDERLPGRYELVVIDVYQQGAAAKSEQIIAVPTLVKKAPLPVRRIIGDLADRAELLRGLDLAPDLP